MEGSLKETLKSKFCEYVIDSTTEWNKAISSYPCECITSYTVVITLCVVTYTAINIVVNTVCVYIHMLIKLHTYMVMDFMQYINLFISCVLVSKEINNFTITYGLSRDPVFSSNQIQFDLEVWSYTYVALTLNKTMYVK